MENNKFTRLADKLICALESEINDGLESVNVKEAGEVVDMIKDLYEADKYCKESLYYKSVTEAMDVGASGYTRMNGNFRMGFNKNEEPYVHSYIQSPIQDHYGRVDFDNLRRYYTREASPMDQDNYISETVQTLEEMYNSSDPNLKTRIKQNVSSLMQSLA